jgi:hypothetical protein
VKFTFSPFYLCVLFYWGSEVGAREMSEIEQRVPTVTSTLSGARKVAAKSRRCDVKSQKEY